jgi:CysZ protein
VRQRLAPLRDNPLLLNLAVFAALIGWGVRQFNIWMAQLMAAVPGWLSFISIALWRCSLW